MIHLRKGNSRYLNNACYCGADATLELAVLKDKHVTCVVCLSEFVRSLTQACERAEAWLTATFGPLGQTTRR